MLIRTPLAFGPDYLGTNRGVNDPHCALIELDKERFDIIDKMQWALHDADSHFIKRACEWPEFKTVDCTKYDGLFVEYVAVGRGQYGEADWEGTVKFLYLVVNASGSFWFEGRIGTMEIRTEAIVVDRARAVAGIEIL